jgi:hypothetical protein
MNIDTKTIGAGFAALAMGAGIMAGYFQITTPEAQKCAVELADSKARLELLTEAKDQCKTALTACAQPTRGTP